LLVNENHILVENILDGEKNLKNTKKNEKQKIKISKTVRNEHEIHEQYLVHSYIAKYKEQYL
jgi:hypothetical protein